MTYATRKLKALHVTDFIIGLLVGWFTAGPVVILALALARAGADE